MMARRLAAISGILLCAFLGSCTWLGLSNRLDEPFDYKSAPQPTQLEVPPDLSQLPKDDRFSVPGGSAPAPAAAQPAPAPLVSAPAAAAGVVAPASSIARIMREGTNRWLEVDASPEIVYAKVKALFESRGWKIAVDDPRAGLIETDWLRGSPHIDDDTLRKQLKRVLGNFDSAGEQNKFRARIERIGDTRTELTISHRGMVEELVLPQRDHTIWQASPPDHELEAEWLQRLALEFVTVAPVAVAVRPAAVAPATGTPPAAAPAPEVPQRAVADVGVHKVNVGGFDTVQIEEPSDRAWRRVSAALDRGGFTVEDRDREKGLFFVRYLDPDYEAAEKEKRSWWDRIFHSDDKIPDQKFRIRLVANGQNTSVEVLDAQSKPDGSTAARHIVDQLLEQMR